MNKRLLWADSLKGCLILLVILGHSIQFSLGDNCESNHLWNLIYSFHMPAFMAISGFLAFRSHEKCRGIGLYKSTIIRRFSQLVIPFILWSGVLVIINKSLSWNTIIGYLLYPDRGLWFLWVLFVINVLFVFGRWIAELTHCNQEIIILFICVLLCGIMILFEPRLLGFQFISYYFLFYSLGYYLHKYSRVFITRNLLLIAILSLSWFVLAWFWQMHQLPSWIHIKYLPEAVIQYSYRFITAVLAVYVLLATAPMVLNSDSLLNKPLVHLGMVSLGIYVSHFVIVGKVVQLFKSILENENVVVVCSFFCTLTFSWLIVRLISKWEITSRLLLGKV